MSKLADAHLVLFMSSRVSLQDWDRWGTFEREVALYRRLRPRVRKLTLVTYGDAGDLAYRERLPDMEIICNRWRLPHALYIRLLPRLYPYFWHGPVIVKSNQIPGADVPLRSAQLHRHVRFLARCGYLHSVCVEAERGADSPQAHAAWELEKRVFGGADHIVVSTHVIREIIIKKYSCADEDITVIPNYVETERFRAMADIARQPGRIGFVGRFSAEKNLFAVLEAVEQLPDTELLLVGDGPLRAELEEDACRRNLPVKFLGRLPSGEIPAFLNSLDAFVFPSFYEGQPKALQEAMACGCAVVGSSIPGITPLVEDGQTGLLCQTDADSIRQALQRILSDSPLRDRLGQMARRFIEQQFSLEHVVEKECNTLERVLQG